MCVRRAPEPYLVGRRAASVQLGLHRTPVGEHAPRVTRAEARATDAPVGHLLVRKRREALGVVATLDGLEPAAVDEGRQAAVACGVVSSNPRLSHEQCQPHLRKGAIGSTTIRPRAHRIQGPSDLAGCGFDCRARAQRDARMLLPRVHHARLRLFQWGSHP